MIEWADWGYVIGLVLGQVLAQAAVIAIWGEPSIDAAMGGLAGWVIGVMWHMSATRYVKKTGR